MSWITKTFCCAMGYIECMGWNILLLVKRIWELFLCNEMCFKLLIHLSTTYFTWFSTIPLTPIVSVAQCYFTLLIYLFIFFFHKISNEQFFSKMYRELNDTNFKPEIGSFSSYHTTGNAWSLFELKGIS